MRSDVLWNISQMQQLDYKKDEHAQSVSVLRISGKWPDSTLFVCCRELARLPILQWNMYYRQLEIASIWKQDFCADQIRFVGCDQIREGDREGWEKERESERERAKERERKRESERERERAKESKYWPFLHISMHSLSAHKYLPVEHYHFLAYIKNIQIAPLSS